MISQFSLRVAFISYLGFLVVSFCSQFRKALSPKSRREPRVPGEISEGRGYEWGGLAARGSRAVPGGLVAASPLDCVSNWLHLGFSSLASVSQVALAGFSPESARLRLCEQRAPGCHRREGRSQHRHCPVQLQSRVHFVPRFARYLFVVSVSQEALAGFSPESRNSRHQAKKGLSAAPTGSIVATTVITQFSQSSVYFLLGLLVLSCGLSFARRSRRFLARLLAWWRLPAWRRAHRRGRHSNSLRGASCADCPTGTWWRKASRVPRPCVTVYAPTPHSGCRSRVKCRSGPPLGGPLRFYPLPCSYSLLFLMSS